MPWAAGAIVGSAVIGGIASNNAAKKAANAQTESAQLGIAEQQRQFDALQALLKPYADAGQGALSAQQDLAGLRGNDAQQQAINGIQNSAQFQALKRQGENSILANASATGNLRGGNVQAALAQYSPTLLSALIEQQYSRLGGITSIGQNAAAMTGNAGMQSGNAIAQLLQQQGAARAGSALTSGNAISGIANGAGGALGLYSAMNSGGSGVTASSPLTYGSTYDYRSTTLPTELRGANNYGDF